MPCELFLSHGNSLVSLLDDVSSDKAKLAICEASDLLLTSLLSRSTLLGLGRDRDTEDIGDGESLRWLPSKDRGGGIGVDPFDMAKGDL